MAALDDVAGALQAAVISVLNTSGVTIPKLQVGIGWPFGPSLSSILGNAQAQVTIYPMSEASQNRTSRKPVWTLVSETPPAFSAAVVASGNGFTITFSGTPAAGYNVHTLLGGATSYDAYYQTTVSDTLATIAAAVAAAVNALHASGVSANASGPSATITYTPGANTVTSVQCNIGGSGIMAAEVERIMTPFQITIWAADGPTRNSLSKIIANNLCLGPMGQQFLYASDGSAIFVRKRNSPRWIDKSQSSYSLYEAHLIYECEYPTLLTTTGTQVEDIQDTLTNS